MFDEKFEEWWENLHKLVDDFHLVNVIHFWWWPAHENSTRIMMAYDAMMQ